MKIDLRKFRKDHNLSQAQLGHILKCRQPNVAAIEKGNRDLTIEQSDLLINKYGAGLISKYMMEEPVNDNFYAYENNRRKIPLYDDVSTVGGMDNRFDTEVAHSIPSDYIDAGDWFRGATAAIRHYGESMIEYPSGCIMVVKEVLDRQLIVPGRDYVVETSEYRVTKRIQKGKDDKHIRAYSTNTETYPDGRMIHEPFEIPWNAVRHISVVLGYVVKNNDGSVVYSDKNKNNI
jgi:transcriptional regulator with XRE-family HTH domain